MGAELPVLTRYLLKYRRQGKLMTYFFNFVMLSLKEFTREMNKSCILSFPKKSDLGIIKNKRDITLTAVTAKVYNALLLNHIKHEIEKILMKNLNGFWRNQSTISQILSSIEYVETNLEETLLFKDFSKAFDSIHRGKMEQIQLAYGFPKETVTTIIL